MRLIKNLILLTSLCLQASCIRSQNKIEIIPFAMLDRTTDTLHDSQGIHLYKTNNFLIRNYTTDNKSFQTSLESFVKKNTPSDLSAYTNYKMVFYKESKITTPAHLKDNPRDLDRYSLK